MRGVQVEKSGEVEGSIPDNSESFFGNWSVENENEVDIGAYYERYVLEGSASQQKFLSRGEKGSRLC